LYFVFSASGILPDFSFTSAGQCVKCDYHIIGGKEMRTDISATEAVRHFSELLNNIKYRRDRYTVIRGGKPAAAIVPVEDAAPERLLGELSGIFKVLPRLDPDDTRFAADIMEGIKAQPPLPEETEWE
jgi:antitoxin (DNA-binding transcriptional repressor) of toxin-antitoxin stability system